MTAADREQQRRLYMERLAALREAGSIGEEEELELIRHFHAMRASLEAALGRLAPEYQRRAEREGEARAVAWLADEAEELGRREGEATRRIFDRFGIAVA